MIKDNIIAHTLLYMETEKEDRIMAENCLKTLYENHKDVILIVYNQGDISNKQLDEFLSSYNINFVILGGGTNVGIPYARQICFKYIWNNLKDIEYITEIHLDMIFTKYWLDNIIQYLENSDEPLLSPGIITQIGDKCPEYRSKVMFDLPSDVKEMQDLLYKNEEDRIVEGFVHPVVHKRKILEKIGGYDIKFLKGKQGYEDDSLLLGYRYYMGNKTNWKPKVYLKSMVYHAGQKQRIRQSNTNQEFKKNLAGLINKYGINGLYTLSDIHNKDFFAKIADSIIKMNS